MAKTPKRHAKPLGRCIFCGGTGLSKEHIWSQWLQGLIPRSKEHGEYWGRVHRDASTKNVDWTDPPESRSRQGSVLQRKVRNVCERHCNNGWMSRVVERSKSHVERLVLGQSFQLDRQAQTDVAAWIGITTVIQEFANRLGARRIPAADRTVLMNTEAPPLSWSIWIARYKGQLWAPMGHYHIPIEYSKPATDAEPDPPKGELQLTTFALREVLVHVFTSKQAEMIDSYRSYIGGASGSAKLVQLWPIVCETLDWPPPSVFSDTETDRLAFDWVEKEWGVSDLPGQAEVRHIVDAAKRLAKLFADGQI